MKYNFVKAGDHLVNLDFIASIDTKELQNLKLTLNFFSGNTETVEGLDAIEIVMKANPAMFEGKRMNFPKRSWIVHNLIAHPIMQILALIGLKRQAMWIHDSTIPRPLGIYNAK
jgi:hypothetical protein